MNIDGEECDKDVAKYTSIKEFFLRKWIGVKAGTNYARAQDRLHLCLGALVSSKYESRCSQKSMYPLFLFRREKSKFTYM